MIQKTSKNPSLITEFCTLCNSEVKHALSSHFKESHSIKLLEESILTDVDNGMPEVEIGRKYGITFRYLEKLITQSKGINVGFIKHKKIKTFEPKDFSEETTTVWSFKSRGNWATHSGEYRGNWSPYIPRNVILKYSKPGETVLDFFCGVGTTAIETKLLGRKCIAIDINDTAIALAKKNVDFKVPVIEPLFQHSQHSQYKIYEPELFVGDARNLSFLKNNSIDLICAHPPYANIIHYTDSKEGDLSSLDTELFLKEMDKVAKESYRVLKPGRQCAILIGDTRKKKHVIPLGFNLINVFLNAGFKIKELVIKRQHNCKTTGFWYTNSIKFNFLLLAHEYLPIFEKPIIEADEVKEDYVEYGFLRHYQKKPKLEKKLEELETSTVWIFAEDNFEKLLNKNVIDRYTREDGYKVIDIGLDSAKTSLLSHQRKKNLLFVKSSCLDKKEYSGSDITLYLKQLKDVLQNELPYINEGGHFVVQTKDVRIGKFVEPLAKYTVDSVKFTEFVIKEIIVVTTENRKIVQKENMSDLHTSHQYLLVYKKKD
ncbi:DNA methyltransferase [Candidatus Kuenenia stuttgartiensis]|jgi:DNA modification methylase|uniref:DNA methylase N-4/N-6 domain-containing protein n=1 Tax=Kuenenia stuttgartiensis TaxID=174633 RepID=A0A2C9CCP2_KUEST|nr:DNA methyltransferase [Candidatus Kuenenia stuttgartiensis]MCL4278081.1 methyltransferase domain-containing protein [Ignavibacteriaceae bacterium]SOH03348.1 hypothetical protein KSMBR1_0837 [Candidatus Kuenenia stuttgartiensis]